MSFVDINAKAFEAYAKDVGERAKSRQVYEAVGKSMQELSGYTVANVKARTPVKTGTLRRAWLTTPMTYANKQFSFTVFNTARYAPFVEYGHRNRNGKGWTQGRFFLRGAMDDYKEQFTDYWRPRFSDAIKEVLDDD